MRIEQDFLHERDQKIYEARKQGYTFRQIASNFNISISTAYSGYQREMRRVAQIAKQDVQDGFWLDLDRLDTLIKNILPMTRFRKVKIDGTDEEMELPPNLDAVREVKGLLAQRAKMLGYTSDVISVEVNPAGGQAAPAITDGQKARTPEAVGKELAVELIKARVITGPEADIIEKMLAGANDDDVVEAEIVEENPKELASGEGITEESVDEWLDEEDEPYDPDSWLKQINPEDE